MIIYINRHSYQYSEHQKYSVIHHSLELGRKWRQIVNLQTNNIAFQYWFFPFLITKPDFPLGAIHPASRLHFPVSLAAMYDHMTKFWPIRCKQQDVTVEIIEVSLEEKGTPFNFPFFTWAAPAAIKCHSLRMADTETWKL